MIVVDLGCITYQQGFAQDESIRPLLRRFKPDLYWGFDIQPGMLDSVSELHGTKCVFSRRAAWTADVGEVALAQLGNCSHILPADAVEDASEADRVRTFDLAEFLALLPEPIVLKVDVEGAEYPLLWDLHERGADERLDLILVEWHDERYANGWLRDRPPLRCVVDDWHAPPLGRAQRAPLTKT